jgi:hypothetical protein
MQSCTKSAEKPATQGIHRCKGKFLFFAKDGSRKPFVAAGTPKRVDCISGHLTRGPDSNALPEIGAEGVIAISPLLLIEQY